MNLFHSGDFPLTSGGRSTYRVECDALSDADWRGLAAMAKALGRLPPHFGTVVGVPRGGLKFAAALERYVIHGSPVVLVADDVWTTGGSMKKLIRERFNDLSLGEGTFAKFEGPAIYGIVAFARNKPDYWCRRVNLIGDD